MKMDRKWKKQDEKMKVENQLPIFGETLPVVLMVRGHAITFPQNCGIGQLLDDSNSCH